ncbi:A-kinase anchor protein 17B-like isoform X2 [Polypterus senegalus]
MLATIVHNTSEALDLCPVHSLYLTPIAKLAITVMLPELKEPGKVCSNWEVMAKLKWVVQPYQFSALRVAKSSVQFIHFEGELETKSLVYILQSRLHGKTIDVPGFSEPLKVQAKESFVDFPSQPEWEAFFKAPESIIDTVHVEGLPCKWFACKVSNSEKPSEEIVQEVFEKFGTIRKMDIPMLDMYREEMYSRNSLSSFGGLHTFDVYIQYEMEEDLFRAMKSLRGMKLMLKEDDGKALACSLKVTFDTTNHLSDAAVERRQQEKQQLKNLEDQRQQEKLREKEEEEAESKRKAAQHLLRRQRKQKKREQRLKQQQENHHVENVKCEDTEEPDVTQDSRWEERKFVLALRRLQSIKLLAVLFENIQKSIIKPPKSGEMAKEKEEENEEAAQQIPEEPRKPSPSDNDDRTNADGDLSSIPYQSSVALKSATCNYESDSLKVTIKQNHEDRDIAQSFKRYMGMRVQMSYVPPQSNLNRSGKREKIYESEEFLNYLLNYYSCPSYARLCHSLPAPKEQTEGWHRMVCSNGKNFQISLRHTDGNISTKAGIYQNGGHIAFRKEDQRMWKFTLKRVETNSFDLDNDGIIMGNNRDVSEQCNKSRTFKDMEEIQQSDLAYCKRRACTPEALMSVHLEKIKTSSTDEVKANVGVRNDWENIHISGKIRKKKESQRHSKQSKEQNDKSDTKEQNDRVRDNWQEEDGDIFPAGEGFSVNPPLQAKREKVLKKKKKIRSFNEAGMDQLGPKIKKTKSKKMEHPCKEKDVEKKERKKRKNSRHDKNEPKHKKRRADKSRSTTKGKRALDQRTELYHNPKYLWDESANGQNYFQSFGSFNYNHDEMRQWLPTNCKEPGDENRVCTKSRLTLKRATHQPGKAPLGRRTSNKISK